MFLVRRVAFPAYLALAAGVLAACSVLVNSGAFRSEPVVLARAVSLDVAVLLPGLYWVLARRLGWPRLAVIPIFLLSLIAARAVLPAGHAGFLPAIELLAVPLELFAIVYLVRKARGLGRAYGAASAATPDFVDALETVLSRARIHPRVAQIALTEAAVVHYGLFAWAAKRPAPPGVRSFTYHRAIGYAGFVGTFTVLLLIETVLLHLVLVTRVELLAWALTALGLYGALFLLADFNAARLRPVLVDAGFLHVRTAFRWRCSIPRGDIAEVEVSSREIADKRRTLRAVLVGDHNVILRLGRPHVAKGPYGSTKRFEAVALAVDDAGGFAKALRNQEE